ncbi:MAG: galactose ABC transporter substrate-binding protein [Ruminococcaceae bacterium]|nr:galactose ABC transporter substrate-binding protein [Oscillospiraceae bacterium]
MKKLLILLITLCLLSTSLVSCGKKDDGEVSVFYYTYSDTYISGVRSSMDKLLKNSGLSFNNYDANSNQTTQTEQIDTAIAKGSRLLIVNIVDTGSDDAAKNIVSKAKNADIPLIFFNRSVSEGVVSSYDKCLFIGTDYEMAGHMQGKLIGDYVLKNYATLDLNGDGKISYVMFKGQQGNAEAEARTRYGVEDANKVLSDAGKPNLEFYDSKNSSKYLVDQGGNWSAQAANDYMKTILSAYSEANRNMVELVIANNDEMALGALAALQEAGYNKSGGKTIPIFGVDATDAAVAKIKDGSMTGTIKQDSEGMAKAIVSVTNNILSGRGMLDGIDKDMAVGNWRINIPYSAYTGEDDSK